jgi:hypothetical protein
VVYALDPHLLYQHRGCHPANHRAKEKEPEAGKRKYMVRPCEWLVKESKVENMVDHCQTILPKKNNQQT